ncbi:hypothetical protein PR048_028966 [Dryococelus australis]|uniref:HTH psq-type domain-containing protein n=1 Tax=Dryococelus australis TaxID=614101 RepID=A0ABQ9GC15_9NEOP|nr:hypothetical protein PR048_028966 [Dryococelus australis]
MARHYKRKTQRQSWNEDNMKKALEAVTSGMGKKTAARQFSVPNINATSHLKILGSKRPVFAPQQEEELVSYMLAMENRILLSIMALLAPFLTRIKMQGKTDFGVSAYDTHNCLSDCPIARVMGFNKSVVTKLFSLLKEEYSKYNYPPHRIFNVDETSLVTFLGKTQI